MNMAAAKTNLEDGNGLSNKLMEEANCSCFVFTPGRGQSKMHLTNDHCGSKITRNSVFDCHLSPIRRQMAIENSVSDYF